MTAGKEGTPRRREAALASGREPLDVAGVAFQKPPLSAPRRPAIAGVRGPAAVVPTLPTASSWPMVVAAGAGTRPCAPSGAVSIRQAGPRPRREYAPWRRGSTNVRRYLLPRLEMRPRIDRPPVLYCRGTSPSPAAMSRPRSKASPVPIEATMAVEINGPILGTLLNRRHLVSVRLSSSISPVAVSMRRSRAHQSS